MTPNSVVRIPPPIRKSEGWRRVAEVLEKHGVRFTLGRSRKHWYVEVSVGDATLRHAFSPTPSDHRAAQNNAAALRRAIRARGGV